MKSSPKPDVSSPSSASNTPAIANGKKLVQARLPFKTLSGCVPPISSTAETLITSVTALTSPVPSHESRKRKLSTAPTSDNDIRAPKINRQASINASDENDLLTSETLESSVDFSIGEEKVANQDCKVVDCQVDRKSESKENVCVQNNGNDDEHIELILSDDETVAIDNHDQDVTPKAKRSLDLTERRTSKRKTKKVHEEKLIMIKLPMGKKAKDAAKKAKKHQKSDKHDETVENNIDEPAVELTNEKENTENKLNDDMDNEQASTSASLVNGHEKVKRNDETLEIENDAITISDNKKTENESNKSNDEHNSTTANLERSKDSSGGENSTEMELSENDLNASVISCASISDDQINNQTTTSAKQKLTPKQMQRRAESEKKNLEKQRAKVERERKLQEEKEQRQREKDEKERQKKKEREEKDEQRKKEREEKDEQRKKEREEKEEQRRREKEERERKRLAEIDERERKRLAEIEAKNEERRRKDEQKEEERKRKEEEKRLKDEAEQSKIRKRSEAFVKFFVPKKTDSKPDAENMENVAAEQTQIFMSFQVKGDMKVAPVQRRTLNSNERKKFEQAVFTESIEKNDLYLTQLKKGAHVPKKFVQTLTIDEDEKCADDDIFIIDEAGSNVQVIEEKPKKIYRAKFLKFDENRRPPYFGTWRKKSNILGPRKPLAQDKTFFDYEIDSDDEWEEEEPGESLHGSEDEKDQESEDDYVIDNEFFVPHGHLSDEEIQNEDDCDDDNSSEAHLVKMKIAQKEFADELKKKTEKLKPRLIGLIWQNSDGSRPQTCSKGIWDLLQARAVMFEGTSVKVAPISVNGGDSASDDENSTKNLSVRRIKIPEKEVPDLIRLINGNQNGCNFLIKEFRAHVAKNQMKQREFSIASIRNKIKELAVWQMCPEEGVMHKKLCWYVPIDTRKRYGLDDLTLPNTWTYTLTPRRPFECTDADKEKEKEKEREKQIERDNEFESEIINCDSNSCGLSETVTSETVKQASTKPACFNIAKFIRVLSEEEKKKQFGSLTLRRSSEDAKLAPNQVAECFMANKNVSKKSLSQPAASSKKRVSLLMSVPCGQEISPKMKSTLVTQFLNNNSRKRKISSGNAESADDNRSSTSTAGTSDGSKKTKNELNSSVIVID